MSHKISTYLRLEYLLFIFFFIFATALMWKTFYLKDGMMHIAGRVWSDFGATLPLERSFAYGNNFPPQYPIFAGPPIRYHFVFFMVVGLLERIGVPIDWALNTLSIVGFFLLLLGIYYLAKILFKSRFVATLSTILFLFNGSFGFVEFFKKHPLSFSTPIEIIRNTEWSSFGPYDGKIVSAFWSLNIFTNQRHLALGYAAVISLIFYLYQYAIKEKKRSYQSALVVGVMIGIFPYIHLTAYMMMCVTLLLCFLLFPTIRKQVLIMGLLAGVIGILQIVLMGPSERDVELFTPGYLIGARELSIYSFVKYWSMNLGFAILLAPIGFLLAKKNQRKVGVLFLTFFVIGNIFQFSPEMASNHKFFNLFIIGANMFVAYALYRVWKTHVVGKLIVPIALIFLTLTGIIDFFPIANDTYIVIEDIPKNQTAQFIVANTYPDSVFLNAEFINDPASLSGRKIYLGWPYFSWSAGYDTDTRFKKMRMILESTNKVSACHLLLTENIDYIEIKSPSGIEDVIPNYTLFENDFQNVFANPKDSLSIYEVKTSCS